MFVDKTVGGMLAKRLQKAEDAIAEMVGYRVRMVETSGTQLCRLLPNTNPWSHQNCGMPKNTERMLWMPRKTLISINTGGFHILNSRNHQPSKSRWCSHFRMP